MSLTYIGGRKMSSVFFLDKNIYFNFEDGYIYKCGKKSKVHMEPQHTKLLKLLVSHSGSICTYEYIYNKIQSDYDTVQSNVSKIKERFRNLKLKENYIDTINNDGYRGYRFCSDYHVVELLETAPNNIEPLTSKKNFVDEPAIIKKIISAFNKDNQKIVFLSGLSGVGKTEIARNFCSKYKDSFYSVLNFALTPDGNGRFEDLLAENDKFFGDTGLERTEKVKVRKDVIKKLGKESLIIIDNFNSEKNLDFLNNLHDITSGTLPTGNAKIIVTTQLQSQIFSPYTNMGCKVIEVEKERNKQQLAYDIFAKRAGVIENGNKTILNIVKMVGYHPLICSILAAQAKEYNYNLDELQNYLNLDLKEALSVEETVWFSNDLFNAYFTPYELLKRIFNRASMDLSEIERQVLGAIILLPERYNKKEILLELVGDLKNKPGCNLGMAALNKLRRKNLVEIDNDNKVVLHPLLEQLYQDCDFLNTGITVAELSDNFKCHLLNNYFVSNIEKPYTLNNLLWNMGECSEFIEYDLDSNYSREAMMETLCEGGFVTKYTNYHIFDKDILTAKYHKLSLYSLSIDNFLNIPSESIGWILHQKDLLCEEEFDVLVNGIKNNSKNMYLNKKDIAELFDQNKTNRTGLIFVIEYKTGRSIILHDYQKNKDYCIVNSSEQRCVKNRYFTKESHSQKSEKPLFARFVGSICGKLPEILIIPEKIKGVPVKEVYMDVPNRIGNIPDEFQKFLSNLKILSLSKTVEKIGEFAFGKCNNLYCVLFNGTNIKIERLAFYNCKNLEKIFFKYSPVIFERNVFRGTHSIKQITIPNYSKFDTNLYDKKLYEYALFRLFKDGYYYQMNKSTDNFDDKAEVFKFYIGNIMKNWKELDDIFDETGNEKLDWHKFYNLWQQSYQEGLFIKMYDSLELDYLDEGTNCEMLKEPDVLEDKIKALNYNEQNVSLTIGKDVTIYNSPTNYSVIVKLDEPIEPQLSWWDINNGLKRIEFPFYRFTEYKEETPTEFVSNPDRDLRLIEDEYPTNVVVSKSEKEHIINDRLSAEEVINTCISAGHEKMDEGNFESALDYLNFVKHFMEMRPELFLSYSSYLTEDILSKIKK